MGAKGIALIGCPVNAYGAGVVDAGYVPPSAGLVLDANPDDIVGADASVITAWANAAPGNDFVDVVGSPTVHDGVDPTQRIMRCPVGDAYVRFTADASHSDAASVYTVAKITDASASTNGIVCLYQGSTERNAFFYHHGAIPDQGFWNNETSWLHAGTSPVINVNTLYTRGWTVFTDSMTVVDVKYFNEDGGTPEVEPETSSTANGMEEFDHYHVGWGGSSTSDFQGDIYRVLVYNVKHDDTTAAAIVSGLRTRYGST